MTTTTDYQARATEEQMQHAIAKLVELRHGRMFHVRRSDVAPELVDLPDLLIIDPAGQRVILAELKSQKRHITHGQAAVLAMAAQCSRFESFLVRPVPRDESEIGYSEFVDWLGGNT